ncbi:hypothetical protein [Alteromonas sp. 14N.309.X.WAT.G.H12]|uniref:hypothetical protein n=1 Tax=Alteromonas sp. 14N.309.X.WAT.G.H12 TaxID=3120824 RepID=UPI002FD5535D
MINFKPAEQAVINMLTSTLSILKANGMTAKAVRDMYEAQLADVEKKAKCRIDIVDDGESFILQTTDVGSDFIRTRRTKTALNLRSKKQNVPIVVTVVQEDKGLQFSNQQLSNGLRELAEYISAMPVEAYKINRGDFPLELGAMPKVTDRSLDDDDDDDDGDIDNAEEAQAYNAIANSSHAPIANALPTGVPNSDFDVPGEALGAVPEQLPGSGNVDLMNN